MISKWPRTPHLPWSLGATSDDKKLQTCEHLIGKQVVIEPKWDGECFSIYREHIHARSIGLPSHPSQARIKSLWAGIKSSIPENMRISGEYLYAKHSIHYHALPDWFIVFAIILDDQILSYSQMVEWCQLLELTPIESIWTGVWDENVAQSIFLDLTKNGWNNEPAEGIVVWNMEGFDLNDFSQNVAKAVRPNHVQTDNHWKNSAIIPNSIKDA